MFELQPTPAAVTQHYMPAFFGSHPVLLPTVINAILSESLTAFKWVYRTIPSAAGVV